MSGVDHLLVETDEAGLRLDRWFKRRLPEVGHGQLQKWLRTGQVRLDGARAQAGTRVEAGQTVRIPPKGKPAEKKAKPPQTVTAAEASDLRDRVLHRDSLVLVIDKPPGLAVQGGSRIGRHLDGMLDALRFDAEERPRLVHRLDKDTSGVLVLGRSASAAARITESFRSKTARKLYWALVVGEPRPESGVIDLPLAKLPGKRGERVTADDDFGKAAVTSYRTVDHAGRRVAWLALEPLTGRTHQLRVHLAALGTPVLNDGKYGGKDAFLEGEGGKSGRMHLHARAIQVPHPDGGILEVTAPLPDHMHESWKFFGFDPGNPDAGFSG